MLGDERFIKCYIRGMMAGHKKSNQLYGVRSGGTGAVTESFLEEGAPTAPSLPVFNPVAPL